MSADTTGQSFPRHPWDVVIAVVAGVALIVVLSLAALVIVPPAVANLGSEASDGSTAASIGDSGATVVVPIGWVEAGAGTDVVTVRTPDGVLTVRLSPSSAGLDATLDKTLDELATGDSAPSGRLDETLASGAVTAHANVGERALGAAVAAAPDAKKSVAVVASVAEGSELATYRPALAELLESISP
jgi:hypothetical protein